MRAGPRDGPASIDGVANVVQAGLHLGALRTGRAGDSQQELGLEMCGFRFRDGAPARELQGTFDFPASQNDEIQIRLSTQFQQR